VFGGNDDRSVPLNSVERYDFKYRVWKFMAPMKTPRAFAVSAIQGNYVYIAGGSSSKPISILSKSKCLLDAYGTAVDSIEKYDTMKNEWKTIGSLIAGVTGAGGAIV
jgi:hypothetical protein